jgi:hypothetical protein
MERFWLKKIMQMQLILNIQTMIQAMIADHPLAHSTVLARLSILPLVFSIGFFAP